MEMEMVAPVDGEHTPGWTSLRSQLAMKRYNCKLDSVTRRA